MDSSAGAYAPDDAQAVTLALLVERAGVVLGGYTSPAARSSAGAGVLPGTPLEDLLTSPDGAVFADWWGALLAACAKAASPDGAETAGSRLALFRTEAGQIIPVMVSVACITGRDEFIVSGSVVSARRLRLLNALHSIGLAISRLDLDRVLSTVRERVFSLMGADG
ncbi:MAG: hypothetical protein JW910_00805, partial [Anaerolineae bacterium]|nr:hypothetical protein [Anaerolineae bacterium]